MTQHLHSEMVDGCFRCDLGRDEVLYPCCEHCRWARPVGSVLHHIVACHCQTD